MPKLPGYLKEIRARAESAIDKPAPLGPDIDLSTFIHKLAAEKGKREASIDRHVKEAALLAGVDLSEKNRSGTYLQVDHSVLTKHVQDAYGGQVEILPISEAMERYDWMADYYWRAVAVDADKYTACAELHRTEGYFIRVHAGAKIDKPIQSCLMLAENNLSQNLHNIILIEEGAEAQVITGCTIHPGVESGLHLGISEFFVKKGASLTFTMIHNWAEQFHVRPRSTTIVEEGGTFVSNYILMKPVRSIQMYPTAILRGKNSRARFQAILLGKDDSLLDIGSRLIHEGAGSRSESINRSIAGDASTIIARGQLVAKTNDCRAHLECRGILSSPKATMLAVPELQAYGCPQAELSHEAAVSPIAEEEISYLMSRGLTREEALATITRGFLNVDLLGLPPILQKAVDKILEQTPVEGSR
jgi:Fe-S cluster assembly scaffold protein SufB